MSKDFGLEPLFTGVDVVVNRGDRIGLVGPNGAGKTTLLKILTGEEPPSAGRVTHGPRVRVGYLAQQVPDPGQSVGEFLRGGDPELRDLTERMAALEEKLAAGGDVLAEYGAVQERWIAREGWTFAARLAEVRGRLDIAGLPEELPVTAVSGGEQSRLMLARLLLSAPDVLLLDEPTNHLDADGSAWLGDWLAGFGGGVVIASHDRALLDRAVTRIVEIDGINEEPQLYEGGYTAYRAEKQKRWQRLLLDFEAQEKDRVRWETDIERTKGHALGTELTTHNDRMRRYAKKVAKKAKARERRLMRQMQSVRWIAEPRTRPSLVLAFPATAAGEGPPLVAEGLTVRRGGRAILDGVDLTVEAGDRIVVTGRNGAGKSTLLRALAGEFDDGEVRATVAPSVLPQSHDALREGRTGRMSVLEFFRSRVPVYIDEAEELLGGYLFGEEERTATLSTLSGGELQRLLLAVLVNSATPVLLLDEPTNHLDFDSLDVIEEAMRAYQGTLVLVTHDAYFAERAGVRRQWTVADGKVTELLSLDTCAK
ncbi:ABC transporter ATP-binding protein [Phytomonospora endophytica]|nr:ABC transporter ATP-binding protein [Phytomonospora endophytica]